MRITEIYHSIQGESGFVGLPCTFIRTTGCNLRCEWCDSEYAFYGGSEKTIDEIIKEVREYGCQLVEITGGEPLIHKDVPALGKQLLRLGYKVLLETSGALDISVLDPEIIKIMDLKCPGSGESDKNYWPNLNYLSTNDEVKFVIKNRIDYEWARNIIKQHKLEERVNLILSPVFGHIENIDIVNWMLEDGLHARFQVQLHKIIWAPETKGV